MGAQESNRATREKALALAVEVESAWATSGSNMSMERVVGGAKLFEAYLLGEVATNGR